VGWARGRAEPDEVSGEGGHFVNWSNTHEVSPRRLYQPETIDELEKIVAKAHINGTADLNTEPALCFLLETQGWLSLTDKQLTPTHKSNGSKTSAA
jgi:hypothetical protein